MAKINCRNGLLFYKLLSSYQEKFNLKNDKENIDPDDIEKYESYCMRDMGFFIEDRYLFSSWMEKGVDFNVSDVMDACNGLSTMSTPEFRKNTGYIIGSLHSSLTKLGESTQRQTQILSNVLNSIEELDTNNIEDVHADIKVMFDSHVNQNQHSFGMSP